jgi:hypothetical protein
MDAVGNTASAFTSVSVPGSSGSQATILDGHPMARTARPPARSAPRLSRRSSELVWRSCALRFTASAAPCGAQASARRNFHSHPVGIQHGRHS